MKIRVLRSLVGEYGSARRGDIVEVSDASGKRLVSRGLASADLKSKDGDRKTSGRKPATRADAGSGASETPKA